MHPIFSFELVVFAAGFVLKTCTYAASFSSHFFYRIWEGLSLFPAFESGTLMERGLTSSMDSSFTGVKGLYMPDEISSHCSQFVPKEYVSSFLGRDFSSSSGDIEDLISRLVMSWVGVWGMTWLIAYEGWEEVLMDWMDSRLAKEGNEAWGAGGFF